MSQVPPHMTAAYPHTEIIVNKIIEELNDFGDCLNDKWSNIAQSLNIIVDDENPSNCSNDKNISQKVVTLWVQKCLGLHIWPGLLDAIEKEMPNSNILNVLRSKYSTKSDAKLSKLYVKLMNVKIVIQLYNNIILLFFAIINTNQN